MDIYEQLPVYRQIEIRLKEYITEKHLPRHFKLPSENQLAAEYRVNVGTVRKALNNLIAENIIYRKHGIGTFVSTRSRKEKILLVPNMERVSELYRIDYFDFFIGALTESVNANLPYEPVIVEAKDFLDNIDDLKLIYPDLAGVIFFRGMQNCQISEAKLKELKIPFMYYGPNVYGDLSGRFPCFYHDETVIANMVGAYLHRKGHKKIAGLLSAFSSPIHLSRSSIFQQTAPSYGLHYTPFKFTHASLDDGIEYDKSAEVMEALVGNNDAVFCFTDDVAIMVIQFIEREMNKHVPGDIAVIGVDNIPAGSVLRPTLTTVSIDNHLNGRECIQKFTNYISAKTADFIESCRLNIIERESC